MAKRKAESKEQRLARTISEIKKQIAAFLPNRKRKGRQTRDVDPCATEQAAYDAAVAVAAQLLIAWEDKQAEATAAQSAYNIGFMAAMAAYIVLQNCRNPPP